MYQSKEAFTLIELLVVVLIIGILAAVALLQYQKAVYKSRLAQLNISVSTAKKVVDSYILANGHPSSWGPLYGTLGAGVDIDLPGNCNLNTHSCFSDAGATEVWCGPDYCGIYMYMGYDSSGRNLGKESKLGKGTVVLRKYPEKPWYIYENNIVDLREPTVFCQWLKDHGYPANSSSQTACTTYGVNLSQYEEE
ncbi:MAG: type II secretion system protein [Elusimicrobiaceae bacterium]|nr:type II secretion system protein [Elusimicrobiaceae bacterium]